MGHNCVDHSYVGHNYIDHNYFWNTAELQLDRKPAVSFEILKKKVHLSALNAGLGAARVRAVGGGGCSGG